MNHPYADLIGLTIEEVGENRSICALPISEKLFNPHRVVHGAVLYSLADTGMGAALYTTLKEGELCATVEIKINYYKPVAVGELKCFTEILNRGKTIANLESSIYSGATLVARANGNYVIFKPSIPPPDTEGRDPSLRSG
jgi:acyl-CoA thioesterase